MNDQTKTDIITAVISEQKPTNASFVINADYTGAHCSADSLTNSYGLLVQAILAGLAFASLIVKRLWEPPDVRRPWLIWFFDTSKQATAACVIHFINVFFAPLFANDPCTWYIVSFLLDSTIGLLVIYIGVRLVSFLARINHWPTLLFGEYGHPPSCRPWWHQTLAFLGISFIMKLVVVIIQQFNFWKQVRRIILSPITNPKIEVTLVMLIIPFLVNTVMFWAIDNFIMLKSSKASPKATAAAFPDDNDCDEAIVIHNRYRETGTGTGSLLVKKLLGTSGVIGSLSDAKTGSDNNLLIPTDGSSVNSASDGPFAQFLDNGDNDVASKQRVTAPNDDVVLKQRHSSISNTGLLGGHEGFESVNLMS